MHVWTMTCKTAVSKSVFEIIYLGAPTDGHTPAHLLSIPFRGALDEKRSWLPWHVIVTFVFDNSSCACMSSDTLPPGRLDSATLRARRRLAAARTARDGISTMIDTLRISKPPRPPSTSLPPARRHALIPSFEGRAQLEARIRSLEDMVATRDSANVKLKTQWGRALLKRRTMERENEGLRTRCRRLNSMAGEVGKWMEEMEMGIKRVREIGHVISGEEGKELAILMDDLEEMIGGVREMLGRVNEGDGASDDDVRSLASGSMGSRTSSIVGDDKNGQIAMLVELIELLETKVGAAHPSVGRARAAVGKVRGGGAELISVMKERDTAKEMLKAVMDAREKKGGEEEALAIAAKAEAELRECKMEVKELKRELEVARRVAERAVRQDELKEKNARLETELKSAKKTVGRLVQERNSLRRTSPGGGWVSNASSGGKTPRGRGANSEAMRRVLDWRKRASSENQMSSEDRVVERLEDRLEDRMEDRIEEDTQSSRMNGVSMRKVDRNDEGGMKKRKVESETGRVVGAGALEIGSMEGSVDVGRGDSISAQSVPVQGFLRRHDSFLSSGNVSASNDAITLTSGRNPFSVKERKRVDGLKDLLSGG